jgi:Thrombospondin type 3 repeat/Dockerin type I domain
VIRRMAVVSCLFLAVATLARAAGAAPPTEADVRRAAVGLYIHGMTAELAEREVGAQGVPALLRLLADPAFPRRDNVVAFLAYLGDGTVTPVLLALLADPPGTASPEDQRALLLVPQALGRIASRGDGAALQALLTMTAPGANGGPIAASASRRALPATLADEILDESVSGLAFAGVPAARDRLSAIADGRIVPSLTRSDLASRAAAALELMKEIHPRPSGSAASAAPGAPAAGLPALDGVVSAAVTTPAYTPDPSTTSHEHGLTFVNHVSATSPMTTTRLDAVLHEATIRAATGDFDTDVPCCLVISRSGNGGSFGDASDGLATIDTNNELTSALNSPGGRVKIVNAINYCGGAGTNIIGCAWTPGNGMVLVRLTNLSYEAVLWIHEYGHNNGLNHEPSDSRMIMYGSDNGANNGLRPGDCAAFHSPPSSTAAIRTSTGACTDDGDAIADPIDNCPTVANQDQADLNGNGIGDACEACVGIGDADSDGVCDPTDNCPTIFNPTQADFDGDGIGNACETGAVLADIDLSGRVDGLDLARIGRAFGAMTGDSRYDLACDLDRSGVVDGSDLAIFSVQFGKKSR